MPFQHHMTALLMVYIESYLSQRLDYISRREHG